jgi:hypothetical protein
MGLQCDKYPNCKCEELEVCNADEIGAVIEAAKALLVNNLPLQMRVDRVVSAVDALEQAEKEEP